MPTIISTVSSTCTWSVAFLLSCGRCFLLATVRRMYLLICDQLLDVKKPNRAPPSHLGGFCNALRNYQTDTNCFTDTIPQLDIVNKVTCTLRSNTRSRK